MRVAIQGFTGSFHAMAAEKFFTDSFELIMCDSFPNLFRSLQRKEADIAVMAIENTIAGTILFNYSLLRNSTYSIIGETFLKIEHCMLALPGQTINDIKEIRSHPMALMQCMNFLSGHQNIRLIEDVDTAYMAELISNNKTTGVAAIAGEKVAKEFGLNILKKNIEDSDRNFTRFLVIKDLLGAKSPVIDVNKATISFSLPHKIGGLRDIMNILASNKMNVTSFQSTPYVGNEWEYFFHSDIDFDDFDSYKKAMDELNSLTINLRILGEYKRGI